MSVKITDNTAKISGDFKQKASSFLRVFAEDVVKSASPNTPKLTGRLKSDVLKQILGLKGKIRWVKVYAQYQERGMRADGSHVVRKYSNGGGPHFAENAIKEVSQNGASIAKRVGFA